MFKSDRPFNQDRDFFGFKFRTRVRYYDEKILAEEMDPEKNIYRIPDNIKIVIDVGAHIGGTAIRCASKGAIVYAFEPEQYNFETLKYNVKLNNLGDKIKCFNLGVGKAGITKLYVHPKASGTTSSYLQQSGLEEDKYQEIPFIRIKELFKMFEIETCDLLKMDCEGSEKDIINDLDDELANKIKQISLEFHDKHLVEEQVKKLSKWYKPENTKRYEWCFRKL
jgi:FkbM family methyltransferase